MKDTQEILVNIQFDDIVDPSQKREAMEKCLKAVQEAGGGSSVIYFY